MSAEQARALGGLYGLRVAAVTGVAQGINSNFVLRLAGGGRVFARVCEGCTFDSARAQAGLLEHLAQAEVPTPRPLQRLDGAGAVSEHEGKATLLFPFCDGRTRCQRSVRPSHTAALGAALGRMHEAACSLDYPVNGAFGPTGLRARLDELRARPDLGRLGPELRAIRRRLDGLAAHPDAGPVPETIVHGDLFRDNVLWSGDTLAALLDFEFAARDAAAFDLMVTMLAWCFGDRLEQPLAQSMLSGYTTVRPLDALGPSRLYPQAQRAALRFALSRIDDYELRPREAIAYKDFRRFLARSEGLEQIGERAFVDWLVPG